MIKIWFKARRLDNGKWIEGYYYKKSDTTHCFSSDCQPSPIHHYIACESMADWELPNVMRRVEIDPATLYQYTTDKNGREIWVHVPQ